MGLKTTRDSIRNAIEHGERTVQRDDEKERYIIRFKTGEVLMVPYQIAKSLGLENPLELEA